MRIWLADVVLVIAAIGLVVVAVRRRTGDTVRRGVHGVVTRPALGLCVTVVLVVVMTVAQHVSGGGSRYARYLLPALGVAAALLALGLDRLWPRVLPAVTVVLLGWWALRNVPSGVDPTRVRRPRDRGFPMPEALEVLPASPWLRAAAVAVIAIGCRDARALAGVRCRPPATHAGLMITLPLCPPKPKLLEIVGPGSHWRGPPVTTSIPRSTSTVLAVGGI